MSLMTFRNTRHIHYRSALSMISTGNKVTGTANTTLVCCLPEEMLNAKFITKGNAKWQLEVRETKMHFFPVESYVALASLPG